MLTSFYPILKTLAIYTEFAAVVFLCVTCLSGDNVEGLLLVTIYFYRNRIVLVDTVLPFMGRGRAGRILPSSVRKPIFYTL